MAYAGYVQPYLAYDGSNILASGAAFGTKDGITIPFTKLDPFTYSSVGIGSVTINAGPYNGSGVSRSIIACHGGNLYTALGIGGLNKVYQFDSNLNFVGEIIISQINPGQGIGALTFIKDDLFVFNSSTDELYRYTPISTQVSTINLPQTGQTKCYDSLGPEINCAATGQDGEIRAGVGWPSPRFTNPDGTTPITGDVVLDQLTGLIWARDAGTPTVESCTGGYKTWQPALDYIACLNDINYLNHNDWRLPNINELETLINAGEANSGTWLNNQGFSNVKGFYYWPFFYYWSSTGLTKHTAYAWAVGMGNGWVGGDLKSSYSYVWPVRSGQLNNPDPQYLANIWKTGQTISYANGDDGDLQRGVKWPDPRFTDNGDGTVKDHLTGLVWTKDANIPRSSSCNLYNYELTNWQGALDFVVCLNTNHFLGFNDWRLPNGKELLSLSDYSMYNPALLTGHPFLNVAHYYYLSSTTAGDNTDAWAVGMEGGYLASLGKYNYANVWPVRGGYINNLRGTVTDLSTGNTIPAVTVSTINGNTQTNGEGNYYLRITSGVYDVTFSKPGYQTLTISNVAIAEGKVTELNAKLQPSEVVSTPNTPNGPISGTTGTGYSYSTWGSSSSFGHSVQYLFDWGDSTNSGWLPVGTTSASKSWSSVGTYSIKAQARCATDTSVVSSWSGALSVTISVP